MWYLIGGPIQCYDLNALEVLMQNNDDSFVDENDDCENDMDFGTASVDDDYESDNENKDYSYATDIFNMLHQRVQGETSSKYLHPRNPELNEGQIVCYYDYQILLYENLYGLPALEANNISDFKRLLTDRDSDKTSRMMEIYTFAKDCNISRANGDRLLKLMNMEEEKSANYNSWKSFDRWIQVETAFYRCAKKTIPWPVHWQINKWKHSNLNCLEEVEIRMRDVLQLIADQCVSPFIQFLWNEDIQRVCYRKQNDKNEYVYSDVMSSDWASESQAEICLQDKNGILLPIMLYYDGVAPDKNMNTSLSPVMGTLGWYKKFTSELLQQIRHWIYFEDECFRDHFNTPLKNCLQHE